MIEVNYIAVLVAAVSSMIIGFAWYSEVLFGKPWMKLMGYNSESLKKEQREMGKWYAVSFVLALVTAYVLFHVMTLSMNFFGYTAIMTGMTSAFWMWLGFVMPVQLTGVIFSNNKSFKLFAINTGYQLVVVLIMGLILALLA